MAKLKNSLSWIGIVVLGLAMGILEDLVFIKILVPYLPTSWDLTGNLFFIFTVPLAQLTTLAVTGTFAWFVLGLHQPSKLITFWACWTLIRATFLILINNPLPDVLIYLLWIALWCTLLGLLARSVGSRQQN